MTGSPPAAGSDPAGTARTLLRAALGHRIVGRYAEAMAALETAIGLAPDDGRLIQTRRETGTAAGIAARDWAMAAHHWAAAAPGWTIDVSGEDGLPAPLVRITVDGRRLSARFAPAARTSPSDHPVIVGLRLLRHMPFWAATGDAIGRRFTVLVDPTDGDGPPCRLPRLAGASRSAEAMPFPDYDFVGHQGYAALFDQLEPVPWRQRRPSALWRGSPTGALPASGRVEDMPRVRLCRLAAASDGRVDAGLHRLVDIDRFPPGTDAALAPLLRPAVATAAFPRWRYQIYIDGHSSAWSGMFQRLATGSPVLRVATADGWRQWYDDRLVPWRTVIPVAGDLSDLLDKIDWLRRHDDTAAAVGAAGRAVARSLDLVGELRRAVPTVLAAERALAAAEGQRR